MKLEEMRSLKNGDMIEDETGIYKISDIQITESIDIIAVAVRNIKSNMLSIITRSLNHFCNLTTIYIDDSKKKYFWIVRYASHTIYAGEICKLTKAYTKDEIILLSSYDKFIIDREVPSELYN